MNKTYIKREEITSEVYKLCMEAFRRNKRKECSCYNKVYALLVNAPVEDVVPVVHGQWIPFDSQAAGGIYYCSACEVGCTWRPNYCPNCGAKMEDCKDEVHSNSR